MGLADQYPSGLDDEHVSRPRCHACSVDISPACVLCKGCDLKARKYRAEIVRLGATMTPMQTYIAIRKDPVFTFTSFSYEDVIATLCVAGVASAADHYEDWIDLPSGPSAHGSSAWLAAAAAKYGREHKRRASGKDAARKGRKVRAGDRTRIPRQAAGVRSEEGPTVQVGQGRARRRRGRVLPR